jgi:hypothetical protein
MLASILILFLSAIGACYIPSKVRLELYDVKDLVYTLDGPSVDIRLALELENPPAFEPNLFTGSEMACSLEALIPGFGHNSEDTMIQFQNGLLIVRAGVVRQAAVIAFLAACRAKNCIMMSLGHGVARLQEILTKAGARVWCQQYPQ